MSKVLVIPDVHMDVRVIEHGIELADKLRADQIVMLGDYFDDWFAVDSQYDEMIKYLKNLLNRRKDIIPLLGNHELSYLGYPCSGHRKSVKSKVYNALKEDFRFLYCVAIDGILYSHAGATQQWLLENKIVTTNMLRYKMSKKAGAAFLESRINAAGWEPMKRVGPARGGKSIPSPLWCDLTELISNEIPTVKQVVGHTPISEIECIGNCWFTDVFSNNNISDEYLFVVDGKPEIKHYNQEFYDDGKIWC